MEVMNAWVWFIGVPLIVFLLFLYLSKKRKYKKGTIVANSDVLEETRYFKIMKWRYRIWTKVAAVLLIICVALGFGLMARPVNIDTISPEIHNRDIMLCLDISSSVDELNLEVCDELKTVVEKLDGERFGISIFNGKSVLLVPLTTDYKYVLATLDLLEASIKESLKVSDDLSWLEYWDVLDSLDYDTYNYKYDGTDAVAEGESSLIGDGLASALFSFPDLKTNDERSRMIIFTTDNELNGNPHVSIEDAAALCAKYDVKVFAVTPDEVTNEDLFKEAVLGTHGGYYKGSSSRDFNRLIEDIRETDASEEGLAQIQTVITDKPAACFGWMLFCIAAYFVICRRFRL